MQILSELDLIQRFGVKEGKDKSRIISSWINKGLRFIDLSGERYFREKDVVDFFDGLFLEKYGNSYDKV